MPISLKSVERLWTAEIWRFNVLFIFIGFVGCIFGPRKINTWWSFCCAKCGWNWCSTFDNMQVALFSTLGLKVLSLFMSPKWEFWGGISPHKWGVATTRPPKGTRLCGNSSCDVLVVKIGVLTDAQHDPKNKGKRRWSKKPKHLTCYVFAETSHVVTTPHGFAHVVVPAT